MALVAKLPGRGGVHIRGKEFYGWMDRCGNACLLACGCVIVRGGGRTIEHATVF